MNFLPSVSLLKKLARDLISRPFRLFGLCLVIAGAAAFKSGVEMAMGGVGSTLEQFYRLTSFADLEIRIMPDDIRNVPDLSALPGVEAFEQRLVLPSQISRKRGGIMAGLLILRNPESTRLNAVHITSGSEDWAGGDRVIADRSLAGIQGYALGDVIRCKVGERIYLDTIKAIGTSPEFFCSASNPDFALPEKGSLGVVFGGLDRIRDALGFTLVNDLLIRYRAGADPGAVKRAVLASLKGANLEKVIVKEEHFSHKNIMLRVKNYRMYSVAIIWTLLGLAMAVSIFTFSRLVLEQRGEIGMLRSLGFGRTGLCATYLCAAAAVGALSCLLSLPISMGLRNVFLDGFAKANGLAFVDRQTDFRSLAVMFASCLAISLLGMLIPLTRLLRLPPIRIIRPDAPDSVSAERSAAAASAYAYLPLGLRYGLRNFARTPYKSALGVLVMGLAIGVPISYGLSRSSSLGTMLDAFSQENWDMAVDFAHPLFEEDLGEMPGTGNSSVQPYFRFSGEVCVSGRCLDGRLLGMDPAGAARPTRVAYGRGIQAESDIIFSKDIAGDLGARIGDSVTLVVNQEPYGFRLAGVTSDIFTRQMILTLRAAQRVSQFDGKATGVYLTGTSMDPETIRSWKEAALATSKRQMLANLYDRWRGSAGIVYITTAFSLMMAVIYVMMTTNLNILERKREYATLLSLGFGRREIGGIIFGEVVLHFLLSISASIPIGILLAFAFNAKVGSFWFEPDFHAQPADFLIPLAAIAISVPAVAFASYRRIAAMDVGSELRYREIS